MPPPPSFDVVRVAPDGMAVMAGRGPPSSGLTIYDGDQALAKVEIGRSGEWVLVTERPLPPGTRELRLSARTADGRDTVSSGSVVVMVPEPLPKVAAAPRQEPEASKPKAQPSEGRGAIAVQLPEKAGEPVRILQRPEGDAASGSLGVDSVDYDEKGNVVIAGRAAPGSSVRTYLDNRPLGEATAGGAASKATDDDGRWTLRPEAPIEPGEYRLRVDEVSPEGKVLARVEIPFMRASPALAARAIASASRVIVQPGNSLWRIARRVYGEGVLYSVIYEANAADIRDPDLIYPGQIFDLPQDRGTVN